MTSSEGMLQSTPALLFRNYFSYMKSMAISEIQHGYLQTQSGDNHTIHFAIGSHRNPQIQETDKNIFLLTACHQRIDNLLDTPEQYLMLPHLTNIIWIFFWSTFFQLCPIQGGNIIICKRWWEKNSIYGTNFSIKSFFGEKIRLSCQNLILTTHLPNPSYHRKVLHYAQEHLEGCYYKHSWLIISGYSISHRTITHRRERHMEAHTNTAHTFRRTHLSLLQLCNKAIKWLQSQMLAYVKYVLDCV